MEDIIHELSSDNCDEDSSTHSPRDSPSLIPRPSPLPLPSIFNILVDLEAKLRTMDPLSPTVQNLLHQLQEKMPYHPPLEIVSGPPLNWPTALLRIDRHLKTTFDDALNNLGRHFLKFKKYQFEIINSDIKNKSAHQVAITFFSEPLIWHETIGNYILISPTYIEDGELTHLFQLQHFFSICSLKQEAA